MKRTTASHQRRRNIADAASGFPDRTRVLLYANLPEGADPAPVKAELRAFAEARDFVVPDNAVIIDIGAVARSRRERPGWFEASKLLRENSVEGLIAPAVTHIASTPGEQSEFRAWLASVAKFANYLDEPDEDAPSAVEVTRADA
ncbi:hypothetical protein ACFC36_15880 [Streptomyces rubiginosohelvolus]|uniref:hypothetical protein n=1 Tax=Streptomyces rubiginosohelvolus TaxID=67362 RepID=UPI0035DF7B39